MRALIVVRLSKVTDATTSPERQLLDCQELCARRNWDVVGVASDLDVSGAVDPFDRKHRPELSSWLLDRQDEFDVIVAYRADRLTRSIRNLRTLVDWAEDNGKQIVSATEQHFDMSSPFAAVLIALIGTVAEMELQAISERNASAFRHNIRQGKWRGGIPPWGYLPSNESGDWRLVQDPEQVAVIREVVRRVLDGEPLRGIAHDLTKRRVLTPKDRFAEFQGREVEGYEWHSGPLKRSLTSPTLLGQVVTREPLLDGSGKPVKDSRGKKKYGPEILLRESDGSPVLRAEPILTREVFDRVCVELSERENRKEPTKRSNGLLLRVAFCAVCGEPAYKLKGGKGRADRYRCKSASGATSCGGRSIKLEQADSLVEAAVLALLGDSVRMERVWDAGSDHSAELARLNTELEDMARLIGSPAYPAGSPQRVALEANIAGMAERREKLAAEAVKPSRWEWKPTGELFYDWWRRQDVQGRNMWLRASGTRFRFDGENNANLEMGGLDELLKQLLPGGTATAAQEMFAQMHEAGVAGIERNPDETFTVHLNDGNSFRIDLEPHHLSAEEEAAAAEFYGWDKN